MAREPQRREQPAPLDAKLVPLERALIARAKAMDKELEAYEGAEWTPLADAYMLMRDQFRALAEELKYW